MNNFKDYCNQTLEALNVDQKEKNHIVAECMNAADNQVHKAYWRRHPVAMTRMAAAMAVVLLVGIAAHHVTTTTPPTPVKPIVEQEPSTPAPKTSFFHYPDATGMIQSQCKLKEPDGTKKQLSYKDVCDYLQTDLKLPYIPAGLTSSNVNKPHTVYVDSLGEVTYDNIRVRYMEKSITDDSAYMNVLMSKGKMPVLDTEYSGTYDSYIHSTKIKLSQVGDSSYQAEFLYENVGYVISCYHMPKAEFEKVLQGIITK